MEGARKESIVLTIREKNTAVHNYTSTTTRTHTHTHTHETKYTRSAEMYGLTKITFTALFKIQPKYRTTKSENKVSRITKS